MSWFARLFRKEPPPPAKFDDRWRAILTRTVRPYSRLPEPHRVAVEQCVARFLAEKQFVAHRGVTITEEMRVCIAGNACVLICALPDLWVFPGMDEIIVHAGSFGESF